MRYAYIIAHATKSIACNSTSIAGYGHCITIQRYCWIRRTSVYICNRSGPKNSKHIYLWFILAQISLADRRKTENGKRKRLRCVFLLAEARTHLSLNYQYSSVAPARRIRLTTIIKSPFAACALHSSINIPTESEYGPCKTT